MKPFRQCFSLGNCFAPKDSQPGPAQPASRNNTSRVSRETARSNVDSKIEQILFIMAVYPSNPNVTGGINIETWDTIADSFLDPNVSQQSKTTYLSTLTLKQATTLLNYLDKKHAEFSQNLAKLSPPVSTHSSNSNVTKEAFFREGITIQEQGKLFLDASNQDEIKSWFRMSSSGGVVTYSSDFHNVVTYAEAERYYRTITTGLSLTSNSDQNTLNLLLKNLNKLINQENLIITSGKHVNDININIQRLEALKVVMNSKQDIHAIYKNSLVKKIDIYLTQLRNYRLENFGLFLPSPPIVRV